MTKKELRAAMRRRSLGMSPAARAESSRRIFDGVERLAVFRDAHTVGLFCSLADEPDTADALARWRAGKRLAVPRVEGGTMEFYEYDPATLRPGAFGIAEPGPGARLCPPQEIDLVVVPGTAFTADGARCGRGRGYYDEYLARSGVHAVKAGVCFAHQLVAELPAEPHDVAMDVVLTDSAMDAREFASAWAEAFGPAAELPLSFWYSEEPVRAVPKVEGCFFKALAEARKGLPVSLNGGNIGCGGGKFYTGFAPMPPYVPGFVSRKERYKQTPEMVLEFIGRLDVRPAPGGWLNFARIDTDAAAEAFGLAEGVLFFAAPDVLSGLVSWAAFDNGGDDAVCAPFGSGCSSVVSQVVQENRRGGRRAFLGLFDPSVRPWVEASVLGFAVPMPRFREMCGTMRASCLFDTHAWSKVRDRINKKTI